MVEDAVKKEIEKARRLSPFFRNKRPFLILLQLGIGPDIQQDHIP